MQNYNEKEIGVMEISLQDVFTITGLLLTAIIAVIGAIIGAVWKLSKWHSGIEHRMGKTDDRLDRVESVVQDLSNKFDKMNDKIINILDEIKEIFKRLPPEPLEQSTSPISLTDYGRKLSLKIDASDIAEIQITRVAEKAKASHFNAYQIQEYCFDYAKQKLLEELKETQEDLYQKIHEVAYEEGINVEGLTRVIALELRDKVLSSMNMLHAEIDQHTPDPADE